MSVHSFGNARNHQRNVRAAEYSTVQINVFTTVF